MQVFLSAESLEAQLWSLPEWSFLGASEWLEFLLELWTCLHHVGRKLKQPPWLKLKHSLGRKLEVSSMGEAQQALSEASLELEAEVAEASADARAEAQQEVSVA